MKKFETEEIGGAVLLKGMADDALAYLKEAKTIDKKVVAKLLMDTMGLVMASQKMEVKSQPSDVLNESQKIALRDAIVASIKKTN